MIFEKCEQSGYPFVTLILVGPREAERGMTAKPSVARVSPEFLAYSAPVRLSVAVNKYRVPVALLSFRQATTLLSEAFSPKASVGI